MYKLLVCVYYSLIPLQEKDFVSQQTKKERKREKETETERNKEREKERKKRKKERRNEREKGRKEERKGEKTTASPVSHFSPAAAASNYLLPPAGPHLVVLSLVPVSKTTRKVTWARGRRLFQLGGRILHQFSFLLVFPPLKFLVLRSWCGF